MWSHAQTTVVWLQLSQRQGNGGEGFGNWVAFGLLLVLLLFLGLEIVLLTPQSGKDTTRRRARLLVVLLFLPSWP